LFGSQVPVFDEMNLHVNKFILDFYNKGIRRTAAVDVHRERRKAAKELLRRDDFGAKKAAASAAAAAAAAAASEKKASEDTFLCHLDDLADNGFVDEGDLWERCVSMRTLCVLACMPCVPCTPCAPCVWSVPRRRVRTVVQALSSRVFFRVPQAGLLQPHPAQLEVLDEGLLRGHEQGARGCWRQGRRWRRRRG
jgi:hypothetical protein